ncbi:MAG: exonuclease SbcCD subunit D [Oscillospiraceae bacterium]|jgi:exonuclease SbcD|nr:exonuclease SbcCD subunit D [Oscillospiraceae bacterium]
MIILHTSDWHLGKNLYDFVLLDDQQIMIDTIIDLCAGQKVDAVLLSGDIYDRPVPSNAATQLYDYFLSKVVGHMGIPVIAIAGNHDSAGRLEFGSALYKTSGYYIYGRPQKDVTPVVLRDPFGEVAFFPIPYLHPADVRVLFDDPGIKTFDSAYHVLMAHNEEYIDNGRRNIALAHGFFSNLSDAVDKTLITSDSEVSIGGMDIADAACFSRFDYTALGHLHAPQWTIAQKMRYAGSPLKYSLSEERQHKSVTVIDLRDKGRLSFNETPLIPKRNVRVIRGTFDALSAPASHADGHFDDYVFAEISGDTVTYPMEKLRVLFPNILGLAFTDATEYRPDIKMTAQHGRLPIEDLFTRFYRDMKGEDIPADRLALLRDCIAGLEKEADN